MNSIKIEAGNEIKVKIKNAREIELYTNTLQLIEEKDENTQKLTNIIIGNRTIKLGDKFSHGLEEIPSTYEVFKINKGANPDIKFRHKYTLSCEDRNKTTDYILPVLEKNKAYFDTDGYLINAYIGNDDKLYLKYRFAKTNFYGELENRFINHHLFCKIDTSIPGYDIVSYTIPEEYFKDIELFKKGKFSKLSENLKRKIKIFYGLSQKSTLWQILTKDPQLVNKMEKLYMCSFKHIDLDEKPKLKFELWN